MDTVQNLKAFLSVAQTGSFSAAARRAGLATSVLAKRIDQLEASTQTVLFMRTTRRLTLTEAGQRWIARVTAVVGDVDDLMAEAARPSRDLEGSLRIKAPTTLAGLYLGEMLGRFQNHHPKVAMDVVLTDRALNPADEGFDIAISVFGAAFSGVVDVPLCPLQRIVCASPAYLAARGTPSHPRDLSKHDTLNFRPTGDVWVFNSAQGPVTVEVRPRMSANDGQVLLAAARAGNGIALLSSYIVLPALRSGALVPVLETFSPPEIWIKALIPENRMPVARIRALVDFLAANFAPPPWDREAVTIDDRLQAPRNE
ncbi:MAG TPA: LysR family transcriptional regulator [Stellaceae bacterium]|nr:LysR family transcriptional regulator [Stellaceae bacterium]